MKVLPALDDLYRIHAIDVKTKSDHRHQIDTCKNCNRFDIVQFPVPVIRIKMSSSFTYFTLFLRENNLISQNQFPYEQMNLILWFNTGQFVPFLFCTRSERRLLRKVRISMSIIVMV